MLRIKYYDIKYPPEILPVEVRKVLDTIDEDLRNMGITDVKWYFEEDERRLVFLIEGERPEEAFNLIESRLSESGIVFSEIVSACVETSASIYEEYKRYIPLLLKYLAYEKVARVLLKEYSLRKLSVEQLISLNLAYPSGDLNSRGRAVLEKEELFLSFVNNYGETLKSIPEKSLSLIAVLYEKRKYCGEDFVSFLSNVLELDSIEPLIQKELISKDLTLTPNAQKLAKAFKSLVEEVEQARSKYMSKGILLKVFSELDSMYKYIVLKSGEKTEFSHAKIFESIVEAGVDSNVALMALNKASEDLVSEKVSSLEVVELVKNSLNVFDPSGKASSLYEFYLTARNYIVVENEVLSRKLLREMAEPFFKDFEPIRAVLDDVIERVYDSIRNICSLAAPRVVFLKDYYSIKLSRKFVEDILKEALYTAMPLLKFLNRVEEAELKTYIASRLKSILSYLSMKSDVFSTLYELISILLLLFKTVPGPSLVTNLLILAQKAKTAKQSSREILISFSESDLNRIVDFCRKLQNDINRRKVSPETVFVAQKVIETALSKLI